MASERGTARTIVELAAYVIANAWITTRNLSETSRDRNAPQQDGNEPDNAKEPAANPTTELASLNRLIAQIDAGQEEHRAAEGQFWRRQIAIGKWLNIITLVAAAVAIVGLRFVYVGIIHADQATIDANRAWVGSTGISASGDINGDGNIAVVAYYNNVGKSPALNLKNKLSGGSASVANSDEMTFVDPGENNTCNDLFPEESGAVIYPGQPTPARSVFIIQRKDIWPTVSLRDAALYLQGCFVYETMGEIHHSWFCFIAYRNGVFASGTGSTQCRGGNGAN